MEKLELNKIYNGDTFDLTPLIPNKSVDLIIADLPYQVTKNSWDSMLPFDKLWSEYKRVIKDNGAIILFGQDKFSAKLMLSNEKMHKYNIIWEKTTASNPFNAKKMPLRSHEDMLVFYSKLPTYNPQKTTGHPRKVSTAHHKRNSKNSSNYGVSIATSYDSTERYPKSVWKFALDKQKSAIHPCQKPLLLIKELIKTFSNEGDLVLDNVCGSRTTGLASRELNRNFILIEKDTKIFQDACERLGQINN